MPLLIGENPAYDDLVAALQAWAAQVDGVNAAERLSQLTGSVAGLPTVPSGSIFAWATATAPNGYLICNGASISRTVYITLFQLFGTTFGSGDGITTFNLPNLQQRVILGKAASGTGSTLGGTGGAIDHTHTGPSHTHTMTTSADGSHAHGGATGAPSSGVAIGHTTTPVNADTNGDGVVTAISGFASGNVIDDGVQTHPISSDGSHTHSGTTSAAGTGATSSNNPPFLALHYIVKT